MTEKQLQWDLDTGEVVGVDVEPLTRVTIHHCWSCVHLEEGTGFAVGTYGCSLYNALFNEYFARKLNKCKDFKNKEDLQ